MENNIRGKNNFIPLSAMVPDVGNIHMRYNPFQRNITEFLDSAFEAPNPKGKDESMYTKHYPSVFEESLMLATGKPFRQLVADGELLDHTGRPFTLDDLDMTEDDRRRRIEERRPRDFVYLHSPYDIPDKFRKELTESTMYVWRKGKGETPFELKYVPPKKSKTRNGADFTNSIMISERPINDIYRTYEEVPEPVFSGLKRLWNNVAAALNRMFDMHLVGYPEVEVYDKQREKAEVLGNILEKKSMEASLYSPEKEPVTSEFGADNIALVRKGVDYGQKADFYNKKLKSAEVKPEATSLPEKNIADRVESAKNDIEKEYSAAGRAYRADAKEILRENGFERNNGEADMAVATLLIGALQDSLIYSGKTPLMDDQIELCAQKLCESTVFEAYMEKKYTPEIGRKLADGSRKASFDELGKLAGIARSINQTGEFERIVTESQKGFSKIEDSSVDYEEVSFFEDEPGEEEIFEVGQEETFEVGMNG